MTSDIGLVGRSRSAGARFSTRAESEHRHGRGRFATKARRRLEPNVTATASRSVANDWLPSPDIDLLPTAVYVCDGQGTIVDYNHRAAELWGRSPLRGDARERHCGFARRFRLDGSELAGEHSPTAHTLATGTRSRDVEIAVERPDGSRRTLLVNAGPVRGERDEVIGAVTVCQDITGWKDMSEALQKTTMLETVQRFAGDLAHSYCNILAAVASDISVARKRANDPNIAKLLDAAARAADKGLALTNRLAGIAQHVDALDEIANIGDLGILPHPIDRAERESSELELELVDAGADTDIQAGNVLLVDDDPTLRAVAGDALTTLGFTVVGTECGDPALKVLRSERPLQLMVVNIGMAASSGLEVLRNARATRPELKTLIITGSPDVPEDLAERCKYAEFLKMPFRIEELAASIGRIMAQGLNPP